MSYLLNCRVPYTNQADMKKGIKQTHKQTNKPRLHEVVSISFSKDKKKKKKRKPMSAPPTTPVSVRYAQYVVNSKKRQDERT
jgi:hypothetical protein